MEGKGTRGKGETCEDVAPCYSNTPPQGAASPSCDAKCLTFAEGRALVSVSATMSSVGQ